MITVDQEIFTQMFNLQTPDIHLFIKEAREAFKTTTINFHVSSVDLMVRADKEPFNEPRMLADGYGELGLWIPSKDQQSPFKAILLAWVGDSNPTPESIQYVYLTATGHMVMARDEVKYNNIKDRTLEEVLTEVIF